jgi:type IV pilus assembly protein PilB
MSGVPSGIKDLVAKTLMGETAKSIITLVDALITCASTVGASDIHLNPTASSITIRFRIDGMLESVYSLPKIIQNELIARLKILSGLRTDEHNAAQDGRFRLYIPRHTAIDVRVSIVPTFYGENAILRLLPEMRTHRALKTLGFSESHIRMIHTAIAQRSGMILVTGPTGSGKTTTLYALMELMANDSLALVTIEDPIEYAMAGVTQIPAHARTGLSFAQGLRSILRQDPDVIMVGEIRDCETAGIATNAALTGHLVLSTLHTNDAATVFPRLLDLAVPAFMLASTIRLVIAQRLVRRTCSTCVGKNQIIPPEKQCADCNGSGYKGRVGIYEVMEVTEPIEQAILTQKSARVIASIAKSFGMNDFSSDAEEKVASGITTYEESVRMQYA